MIEINDDDFKIDKDFYLVKLEKMVKELDIDGNIVIKLGDKEESQTLNVQYREKDYPTDVLSFPFNEEVPEEGFYLGDIFICFPVAEEQAKENGISLEEELFTLMIHGVLHLADYDHETDTGEMLKLQQRLLKKYFSIQTP
ncbi:MAG: rRNA maturation RNase YbeY [bacterium]|nr:rRNA maturation RNase YbeY [bacterium]